MILRLNTTGFEGECEIARPTHLLAVVYLGACLIVGRLQHGVYWGIMTAVPGLEQNQQGSMVEVLRTWITFVMVLRGVHTTSGDSLSDAI